MIHRLTVLFCSVCFFCQSESFDLVSELGCVGSTDCLINTDAVIHDTGYWINYGVYNNGAPSVGGRFKLVISTDTILDDDDYVIVDKNYFNIDRYDRNNSTILKALPESLGFGLRYVLAVVDVDNEVIEDDETNNLIYHSFWIYPPLPDLRLKGLPESYNIEAGKPYNAMLDFRIMNDGFSYANNFNMGYFVSSDSVMNENAVLIDNWYWTIGVLDGPFGSQAIDRVTIPGLDVGKQYLHVVVDYDSLIEELFDTNNVATIVLNVVYSTTDYECLSHTVSATDLYVNDSLEINVDWTVRNDRISSWSTVAVVVSKDTIFDDLDVVLKTYSVNNPEVDSLITSEFAVKLPTFEAGEYYVLTVLDGTKYSSEVDEDNNYIPVEITMHQHCGSTLVLKDAIKGCRGDDFSLLENYDHGLEYGDTAIFYITDSQDFHTSQFVEMASYENQTEVFSDIFKSDYTYDTLYSWVITGVADSNGLVSLDSNCSVLHSGPVIFLKDYPDPEMPEDIYFCDGDSAVLKVTNGKQDWSYSWNNYSLNSWMEADSFFVSTIDRHYVSVINDFGCNVVIHSDSRRKGASHGSLARDINCDYPNGLIKVSYLAKGTSVSWDFGLGLEHSDTLLSFTGLDTGNYELGFIDSIGCKFDENYRIDYGTPFTISAKVLNNVSCFGGDDGSIKVNRIGGAYPIEYSWSSGSSYASVSELQVGWHYVSVSEGQGCTRMDSVLLTQPDPVIHEKELAIAAGDSSLLGGVYVSFPGIYFDTIRITDDCDSLYKVILTVDPVLSINEIENGGMVHPNPVSGNMIFVSNITEGIESIDFYDNSGRYVKGEKSGNAVLGSISIEALSNGLYYYRISYHSGKIETGNIVVQR